ncbi:HAD-IIB family hydrolase [Luteolibacter yonseiensis]|uniref:HAD-IIB family hydrolase n=1 Tax=Luteolibacter yonseiensis TaxID=1144680 RepID=A0A934R3S7_9BACT|nr:HAD-IIB family hydrolase [Luteolibacter yonseiensis]MBK1816312.1 HAD-IIB family hydrolase [Luteolibacter yonseiensis]
MTALPHPPTPTAILSFDFDGTLHHPSEQPPVPIAFFQTIRKLREEQGIVWGINTGRSMAQMAEGFVESGFPFLPDWVVAREREIYFPTPSGRWLPDAEWNNRCEKEIHGLFKHAEKLLAHLRHEIEQHTGAQWIEFEGDPAGVISKTEEEMEWIVDHIGPIVAAEPHLSWQRNSIYLRFGHRDFQKGSSLTHVAGRYQLPADRRFAIGDSHNDLEMLDMTNAGMTACPANSVADILRKVVGNGGYIARSTHARGAIEALNHYFLPKKND